MQNESAKKPMQISTGRKVKGFILTLLIFLIAAGSCYFYFFERNRNERMLEGCSRVMAEIRVMQVKHKIDFGVYSNNMDALAYEKMKMGAWGCQNKSLDQCMRVLDKQFSSYCDLRKTDIKVDEDGGYFIFKTAARDDDSTPMCVSPAGFFIRNIADCRLD